MSELSLRSAAALSTSTVIVEPSALLGSWHLNRDIVDERASQSGTVSGTLRLREAPGRIDWTEHGTLTWNSRLISVSRSYCLRRSGAGWWLHFGDGRPFHPWLPGEWVKHPCGEDTYRGLVTLRSVDEWRSVWTVCGPDKSLRISTRFERQVAI